MDIFDLFTLCGGLAFFLFGMNVMSSGLEKMAGGKLEGLLNSMTSNKFKGLLVGAGITVALQSSSAVTVMLVGLVNSSVMTLTQSVSVIMGSNIGTTLTAWILSLSGIESDNVFMKMLKPSSFSPILALVGIVMLMFFRKDKIKDAGSTLVGFGVLMYGMTMMSSSVDGLADMPIFSEILVMFNNPIMGVLTGAIITGIIQSSAASVGMLQAIALTGGLTYGMAIPIIMGQNIGTCVTALLSSIGTTKNAKRVAAVHILFNVVGTVLCLGIFLGYNAIFGMAFADSEIDAAGIALCHSVFNVFSTLVLFPFGQLLAKLATIVVPNKKGEEPEPKILIDDRLLQSPPLALSESRRVVVEMAHVSHKTIDTSLELLTEFSQEKYDKVVKYERRTDEYEDKIGSFLVKLAAKDMTNEASMEASMLLHSIGDLERLGDHARNIAEAAKENHLKNQAFSESAIADIQVITKAINEIMDLTLEALETENVAVAAKVEPLEEVIDDLTFTIKSRHIDRLQKGECTIALGFILNDLVTDIERISDHCSNIAMAIIQLSNASLTDHNYAREIKSGSNKFFTEEFNRLTEKYTLSN